MINKTQEYPVSNHAENRLNTKNNSPTVLDPMYIYME